MTAIRSRRSIRQFVDTPIQQELIVKILQAGVDAPSAKNRQPWRFVVVTHKERTSMIEAMGRGLEWMAKEGPSDPTAKGFLKGAWHTLSIMEKAPVTIFILNPEGKSPLEPLSPLQERFGELAHVQSVGACIENMCLAATDLGLGSLWICDVFSAYPTLMAWLGTQEQLVAALSIGVAAEAPAQRPRRAVAEVTTWR